MYSYSHYRVFGSEFLTLALCAKLSEALLTGCKSLLSKVKTKQDISSVAKMLAKSLNWVDLPETILTGNCVCRNTDGETAYSKRTQSFEPATREAMNTSRKEARNLPRVNRPRNQVEEVEGEIATYVEASIALTVKVRSVRFHRGMLLWRVSREASSNLGDLSASLQRVVIVNKTKASRWVLSGRSQICNSTPRR